MRSGTPTGAGSGQDGSVLASVRLTGYLTALMVVQAMAFALFPPLAPYLRQDLGLSTVELGAAGSAAYAGTAVAAVWMGARADRHAQSAVVTYAAVGMALGLAAVALPWGLVPIVIGLFVVGVARSAVPPLTDRLGYLHSAASSRGLIFGIKQTGAPLGMAAIGICVPLVAEGAGWQVAVLLLAGFVLASTPALRAVGRLWRDNEPELGRSERLPAAYTGEGLGESPLSDKTTLRLLARLWPVAVYSVGCGLFSAAIMAFLTLFLIDEGGLNAVTAGRWYAMYQLGSVIGRVAWGWLSDRAWISRGYMLAAMAVLSGTVAVTLATWPAAIVSEVGVAIIVLLGSLASGWVGITRAFGTEVAGALHAGRAGGLMLSTMMLGGLLGPVAFGWLVQVTGDFASALAALGLVPAATGIAFAIAVRTVMTRRPSRASPTG